jgi:hypothetical protein
MTQISPFRLNLLRMAYLVLVIGLGSVIWPTILDTGRSWPLMSGVVTSMLGALSLLSLLGLRYPLQMLPLLFFEMAWKAIWLARIWFPSWSAGHLDAPTVQTAWECLPIVIFPFLIPWDHVVRNYVIKAADPWWRHHTS